MRSVCDRCKKSTLGKGYCVHRRHDDDPEDYFHFLCLDCNPAYEREEKQWQEAHAIPFTKGMTRQEKIAVVDKRGGRLPRPHAGLDCRHARRMKAAPNARNLGVAVSVVL
jgi:hypothetical protein